MMKLSSVLITLYAISSFGQTDQTYYDVQRLTQVQETIDAHYQNYLSGKPLPEGLEISDGQMIIDGANHPGLISPWHPLSTLLSLLNDENMEVANIFSRQLLERGLPPQDLDLLQGFGIGENRLIPFLARRMKKTGEWSIRLTRNIKTITDVEIRSYIKKFDEEVLLNSLGWYEMVMGEFSLHARKVIYSYLLESFIDDTKTYHWLEESLPARVDNFRIGSEKV